MGLEFGVKEWSAVVNAIGDGKQTILIRTYACRYAEFFLYPTFSFYSSTVAHKDRFSSRFQSEYLEMAEAAAKQTQKRAQDHYVDLQYWAEIDEIVCIDPSKSLSKLKKHYIWSPEHIEDYRAKASRGLFVWIVRAYAFPKTITIGRVANGVPNYYRHPEPIDNQGSRPVLNDDDYQRQKDQLLQQLELLAVR